MTSNQQRLSLEDIHRSLFAIGSEHGKEDSMESTDLKTVEAISTQGSTKFDEKIHEYALFARPTSTDEVEKLGNLVTELAVLCGSNQYYWKIFMLVAFRRRYHIKSPIAKDLVKQIEKESMELEVDGDGERLVYYITCLVLHRHLCALNMQENDKHSKFLKSAVECMIRIAPELGGTRDINTMTEHFCFQMLLDLGHVSIESPTPDAPADFKDKLVLATKEALSEQNFCAPLIQVLNLASGLLDADFEKCKETQTGMNNKQAENKDLFSTIHVTIPHNGRGSSKGKSWQRKMVNSVAEVLLWKLTHVAHTEERFSNALEEFQNLPSNSDAGKSLGHDCILRMQTTARKRRKMLNDCARDEGCMLSSLYLMNRSGISLRLIRRAKAGDLDKLTKLAKKNKDEKTLAMILKRNLDPSKATPIESIDGLVNGWINIRGKGSEDEDTIEALELHLQDNTVRVTVEKLKGMVKNPEQRRVLVTCLTSDVSNRVCAVLVAAALGDDCRLFLNSDESRASNHEDTMELLNSIIRREDSRKESRTIEDLLSTKVDEKEDVIIFSSTDLELDENILQSLQEKDVRVRVHSTHKVEVPSGTIKVQLDDKVYRKIQSGTPFSLSVLLDCTGSMGREIEGCKKGAMALINSFNDLAPVKYTNFLGYWDPISSKGDPEPRSTGYLEPTKDNLKRIQKFVNEKLPCTGGGDEPEDIPAALRKLIDDIKEAGLTADECVHFCFFIADAGFRPKERAKVMESLNTLKEMGFVMVMCACRKYGTCEVLCEKNKEVFGGPIGQYIQLDGVGKLASIAATVTESIRASLFQSSNVASVTASVGQTIDSIRQLCDFQRDHQALKKVEELAMVEDGGEEADSGDEEMAAEETAAEKGASSALAAKKEFNVTSRDRLFLQLSRLPPVCHEVVESAFGGKSLQGQVASAVAKQMLEDETPIVELQRAGYPSDVVDLVRGLMGGHGQKRIMEEM